MQFTVASILLTAVMLMYAQNAALRAADVWQLPSDPIVQVMAGLDSVNVDPEVLRAELLRAPQIMAVTGVQPGYAEADAFAYTRAPGADAAPVRISTRFVGYDFFETVGAKLIAGRSFERGRDRVAPPETGSANQTGALGIVVDSQTVRLLGWSSPEQALGQVVYQLGDARSGLAADGALALEIIGVVQRAPLAFMAVGIQGTAFRLDPYTAQPLVRVAADDVAGGVAHIERIWEALTGRAPGSAAAGRVRLVFLDDALEASLTSLNALTTALLIVVVFGFLVALAGIFGMALFVANRRRREIGIRKSLSQAILRQLLVEFGKPVLIGNLLAWPIGYLLADIYVDWFVERMTFTPWPYVASLGITLSLAWLGVGRQALDAARLVPARVLRDE